MRMTNWLIGIAALYVDVKKKRKTIVETVAIIALSIYIYIYLSCNTFRTLILRWKFVYNLQGKIYMPLQILWQYVVNYS